MKAASACIAWESSASRLDRDENSHSQPNQKYALTTARILVHYMVNGGFLGGGGTVQAAAAPSAVMKRRRCN